MKQTIKGLITITLPTLIVMFLLLELIFRVVIPASDPPLTFYNAEENMVQFSNDQPSGLYTIGKFAELRSEWTINNFYWNYPIDFDTSSQSQPLIAVIGDSYIEAFQVNSNENYPYLLHEKFGGKYNVYGFGLSGSPFSQYLHYSRYVNKYFDPDILIFNLVHNDFAESLSSLHPKREFLRLKETAVGQFEEIPMKRSAVSPTGEVTYKKILYKSAFFRYLHRHLYIFQLFKKRKKKVKFEANTEVYEDTKIKDDIGRAIEYLVTTIKEENPEKRIIFVMDGPKGAIYDNQVEGSSVFWMHDLMDTLAAKAELEFIDLTYPMLEEYQQKKEKFNSDIDTHWNQYGHQFVADYLYNYLNNN